MPINVLILEDEPLMAWKLEKMFDELGGYHIVAICQEAETATNLIEKNKVDLLLVDVRLKGSMNGITFAKTKVIDEIPIIIITQYEEENFYRNSLDIISNHVFLIKPFHKFTLDSVTRSLLPKQPESLIYVKIGSKREVIHPKNILWVEAKRNYCNIKTINKEYTVKRSLRLIGEQLIPTGNFIYIHKSFIVQMEYIKRIDLRNKSLLIEDNLLPIGRNFIKNLKENLRLLG